MDADRGPALTVVIPTRDREAMVARTLRSVVEPTSGVHGAAAEAVEVVVSDNAADPDGPGVRRLVGPLLAGWPGPTRYVRRDPPLGMVAHFNACLSSARGRYVLLLHDDDYLLSGGLAAVLAATRAAGAPPALVFGCVLVDRAGVVQRRQTFRTDRDLGPTDALAAVLRDSSFVRAPTLVVRRDAYDAVGPFLDLDGPEDVDMQVRLFARSGVGCRRAVTAAYTVHEDAATTSMFTGETVDKLTGIFDRAAAHGLLPATDLRRHRRDYLHQFILGGTWRALRAGDRHLAARTMRLFEHPDVAPLGWSPRWAAIRTAFRGLTAGA